MGRIVLHVPVVCERTPRGMTKKKGDAAQRTNYRQMKEDPSLPLFPFPSSLSTFFFSPLILDGSRDGRMERTLILVKWNS